MNVLTLSHKSIDIQKCFQVFSFHNLELYEQEKSFHSMNYVKGFYLFIFQMNFLQHYFENFFLFSRVFYEIPLWSKFICCKTVCYISRNFQYHTFQYHTFQSNQKFVSLQKYDTCSYQST